MPDAVVLINPRARAGARPPLGTILGGFRAAGWDAEVWAGDGVGWTERAARRAVEEGVSAVFGAGGDGALAEILPALLGTSIALGVVPLGTGNVWARELGLPLDPRRAIEHQLAQPSRQVDVGRANGRLFLVIASAGFDAQIVQLVESTSKALGQIAYPLVGVSLAGSVRGERCRVTIDDDSPRELDLLACMAMNGRLYGGLVPLLPDARVDDGLLDAVLFTGSGPIEAAAHTVRVLAGRHIDDPSVTVCRVRRLRIESLNGPLPVQLDGDPRGTTPLEVEVVAGGIRALGVPTAG